ncbi:MAG: hypothetical protein ACTSQJ_03835 [Promethearchaeota archaeon]
MFLIRPFQTEEPEGKPAPGEAFQGPNLLLWVLAWIFFVIGIVALTILIIYTKYGRDISIKLSVISIMLSSIFLGFSIHFFLLHLGL